VQAGAGLPTSFAYDIAISGIDVFAATNNGVYSSTINGSSWTPANSACRSMQPSPHWRLTEVLYLQVRLAASTNHQITAAAGHCIKWIARGAIN